MHWHFFNGKRFCTYGSDPVVCDHFRCFSSCMAGDPGRYQCIWRVDRRFFHHSPVLAPFIYGTLERLLLPFGLHHMLTIPMNYTSFGGTYEIMTGVNAGSKVFGQDPLWLAWVNDLINFKNAGDMAAYTNLLTTVTPARFKVGQMIGATGLISGLPLQCIRE